MTAEQYQSSGRELIEEYYRVLNESVSGYGPDEFRSDLGHAAMVVLMIKLFLLPNANLDQAKVAHAERGTDWRSPITLPSLVAADLDARAAVERAVG